MKWLVTFKRGVGRQEVVDRLESLGCAVLAGGRGTALGADEEVLSVEGPADLARLAAPHAGSWKVYPNSRMEPY